VVSVAERPRETSGGALPRGPHSLSRAEVSANQRGRMIDATIEVVGEKGYAELTVADIIKRAGVSRRAFYEHFSNREACFLATYDTIMAESSAVVAHAFGHDDGNGSANGYPTDNGRANANGNGIAGGVQGAIEAICKRALRRPDVLKVLMVEIGAAGPEGTARREQLGAGYENALRESLGLPPGPGPIPNPVLRGVIGGISTVLYTRVQEGKRKRLLELAPDLVQWATSYWPAPPEMMTLVDPSPKDLPPRSGGRAPGTLSPRVATGKRKRLVGGENGVSAMYVAHNQRERILDAVANLTAASGYAALTVEGIATEAAVSLQAFYEHFPSKEDAFLVTYEVGHGKALALVERAFESHRDWRMGVRAGIAALFDYLAGEPAFAHIALVDVQAAGPRALERAQKALAAYAGMLAPGFRQAPRAQRPPQVAAEAIAGGIFELALHHALQRRMHELPTMVPRATYFALAPFIGAEAAGRVAVSPETA
jgi:AcrR family transcriptional regulator